MGLIYLLEGKLETLQEHLGFYFGALMATISYRFSHWKWQPADFVQLILKTVLELIPFS